MKTNEDFFGEVFVNSKIVLTFAPLKGESAG